jgi:hypothetical protein
MTTAENAGRRLARARWDSPDGRAERDAATVNRVRVAIKDRPLTPAVLREIRAMLPPLTGDGRAGEG